MTKSRGSLSKILRQIISSCSGTLWLAQVKQSLRIQRVAAAAPDEGRSSQNVERIGVRREGGPGCRVGTPGQRVYRRNIFGARRGCVRTRRGIFGPGISQAAF